MAETLLPFQIATRDPEEAHDWLRTAYADHTVTLAGSTSGFRFRHDVIDCGPFKLGVCDHSMTLRGRWSPLGDQLLISRLLEGRFDISCRGSSVAAGPGDTFAYDPDVAMQVEWSDIRMSQIRLDRPAVERVLAEFGTGRQAVGIGFDLARPLSPAHGLRWARMLDHVVREVEIDPERIGSPLVMRQVFRLIVATALDTFPHVTGGPAPLPGGAASVAAVRRAVAFMEEHAEQDIDLVTIAEAARVGPRALQRAFRRSLDVTPLEYLRSVRLGCAHDELEQADVSTGVTVGEIAARWGFGHPGRFAAAYRARFGHAPSDHLRR